MAFERGFEGNARINASGYRCKPACASSPPPLFLAIHSLDPRALNRKAGRIGGGGIFGSTAKRVDRLKRKRLRLISLSSRPLPYPFPQFFSPPPLSLSPPSLLPSSSFLFLPHHNRLKIPFYLVKRNWRIPRATWREDFFRRWKFMVPGTVRLKLIGESSIDDT